MANMRRIGFLLLLILIHVMSFAQRGRGFRPEWDMDNTHIHHSINDDMWSFLFVIGLIIIILVYSYLKGLANRQKEKSKVCKNNGQMKNVEKGCCLIYSTLCILALIAGLIIPWSTSDNSDISNFKQKVERIQKKEKTLVVTIVSENDYKQSHVASKDEFVGKDTIYYYEHIVYQNKTGRDLTYYLVEYNANGSRTVKRIKTFKTNEYFKGSVAIPFQKPPTSIDFNVSSTHYNNWKSRSRWGNKKEVKKSMYFLDYSDYVSRLN